MMIKESSEKYANSYFFIKDLGFRGPSKTETFLRVTGDKWRESVGMYLSEHKGLDFISTMCLIDQTAISQDFRNYIDIC